MNDPELSEVIQGTWYQEICSHRDDIGQSVDIRRIGGYRISDMKHVQGNNAHECTDHDQSGLDKTVETLTYSSPFGRWYFKMNEKFCE